MPKFIQISDDHKASPIYAEGSPRLPSGVGAWSAKELLPKTYVIDGQSNASSRRA